MREAGTRNTEQAQSPAMRASGRCGRREARGTGSRERREGRCAGPRMDVRMTVEGWESLWATPHKMGRPVPRPLRGVGNVRAHGVSRPWLITILNSIIRLLNY